MDWMFSTITDIKEYWKYVEIIMITMAQIPLDLSCRRQSLLPGVSDKVWAKQLLQLVKKCKEWKMQEMENASFSQVWGMRGMGNARNHLHNCRGWKMQGVENDVIDLFRRVEIDLSRLQHVLLADLSATCLRQAQKCRRTCFEHVLCKIHLTEFRPMSYCKTDYSHTLSSACHDTVKQSSLQTVIRVHWLGGWRKTGAIATVRSV